MQSEQIDKLAEALALAQKDMSLPKKNRTVTVKTNNNSNYTFEYTTLDAIIEHVREPLTKNGLWFVQTIAHEDAKTLLDTTLTHTSGQWIRSRAHIAHAGGRAQEFGSALTYMRRYALSALLGIASEDDDDANVADGNAVTAKVDRPLDRPKAAPQTNGNGNGKQSDPRLAAVQWAREAEETVKRFIRIEDLRAWDDSNAKAMAKLRSVDATIHNRLNETIAERFRALNPMGAG